MQSRLTPRLPPRASVVPPQDCIDYSTGLRAPDVGGPELWPQRTQDQSAEVVSAEPPYCETHEAAVLPPAIAPATAEEPAVGACAVATLLTDELLSRTSMPMPNDRG